MRYLVVKVWGTSKRASVDLWYGILDRQWYSRRGYLHMWDSAGIIAEPNAIHALTMGAPRRYTELCPGSPVYARGTERWRTDTNSRFARGNGSHAAP